MRNLKPGTFLAAVLAALAVTGCGEAEPVCDGHNGNSAVAACHPGDSAIQSACPDNSNGQDYAAPDESCLAAVRNSD
jgi:hypothetical protein